MSKWQQFKIYLCLLLCIINLCIYFYLKNNGIDSKESIVMALFMGACAMWEILVVNGKEKKDKDGR